MGKAKFTKGEWDAVAPSKRHIMECGTDITTYEVDCGEIAVCGSVFLDSHGYSLEEAAANAYLIAAAPEMYEMLSRFVELVEDDSSEDFLYEFHKVKALLAKARGEL